MDRTAPTISVLTPALNEERALPRAIRSVQAQTFTDWELIIVDDGSTDRTRAIAEGFAADDERIKVFSGPHRGGPAATNECLRHARGEWVAIQDADDYAHETRLERQLAFARAHPTAGMVGSYGRRVTAGGRDLGLLAHGPLSVEAFRRGREEGELFYLVHTSVMIRRTLLEDVGGYPEEYVKGSDVAVTNLRLAPATDIVVLPEALVYREMNPRSITRNYAPEVLTVDIVALNIRRRLEGLPELSPREAADELIGGSRLQRLRYRRRGIVFQSQVKATALLATGSPRGIWPLLVACTLAPIATPRTLLSRAGDLVRARLGRDR